MTAPYAPSLHREPEKDVGALLEEEENDDALRCTSDSISTAESPRCMRTEGWRQECIYIQRESFDFCEGGDPNVQTRLASSGAALDGRACEGGGGAAGHID